ncbi:hypothetical protein HMPREF2785_10655 [Corynebacterium sp. HMSC067D03]|nr:hypothetical protein HMPREF2785_10655 [Corynebacterium sp. HMSC067D03]OHO34680.1 hypothetical protein HMPREF2656_04030 [Corynebacterium sp. HMSC034B08]
MVRVEDILADLALLVVAKAQGVAAFVIGLAVDGLEDAFNSSSFFKAFAPLHMAKPTPQSPFS